MIPTGDWNRTLRFGWLPEGMTPSHYAASTTGEVASFVRDDSRYLTVTLYEPGLQPLPEQPGWQRLTVGDRPGRVLSRTTRTLVKWQLPSGRWADLVYEQPREAGEQPALQAVAVRIAEGVTEGDPEPVRVAFALTHLPRGMRIVGVRSFPGQGGAIEVAPETRAAPRWETSTGPEAVVDDHLVVDGSKSFRVSVMVGTITPGQRWRGFRPGRVRRLRPARAGGRRWRSARPSRRSSGPGRRTRTACRPSPGTRSRPGGPARGSG